MSKPKHKWDPKDQDQDQDQKQDQAQAQANLQAQLQGQGQGQAQGQGQLQFAVQSLDSKSENDNDNDNDNENKNENSNENKLDNKLDNSLDNKVDNEVDNNIENKIENTVENKVDVAVDVKVDLELDTDGLSTPVIDLSHFTTAGSVVMPDVVNQKMEDGNQFNIDQVNNLVDQDANTSQASYNGGGGGSWCDPGASFNMEAKIEGGESKIDAGDIGARADVASSADAAINQSAFDQNITQGANIQFNSITIQAAGVDLTDSDTL
ncbi:hypothetical protein [Bradyrhizobium paxllaeri]|uniref:hypothetical protein n=1 Tax=Bradyrhizobium paxllaeri TaxID=190148 RepID=UPI0008107420|nr:hypothetical protein [Bradyrhizobium paxllaeri]